MKWVIPIVGGVILALCVGGGISWLLDLTRRNGAMDNEVRNHARNIDRLEKAADRTNDRVNQLSDRIAHKYGAVAREGKVTGLDGRKLTVRLDDGKEQTFDLPPRTAALLQGDPVRLADLKPGMRVRVLLDEKGRPTLIDAEPADGK